MFVLISIRYLPFFSHANTYQKVLFARSAQVKKKVILVESCDEWLARLYCNIPWNNSLHFHFTLENSWSDNIMVYTGVVQYLCCWNSNKPQSVSVCSSLQTLLQQLCVCLYVCLVKSVKGNIKQGSSCANNILFTWSCFDAFALLG